MGSEKTDRLPLLTALLGLAWNLGAVAAHVMRSFADVRPFPSLVAAAFTALGFLPAAVVHSLMRTSDGRRRPAALPQPYLWRFRPGVQKCRGSTFFVSID